MIEVQKIGKVAPPVIVIGGFALVQTVSVNPSLDNGGAAEEVPSSPYIPTFRPRRR